MAGQYKAQETKVVSRNRQQKAQDQVDRRHRMARRNLWELTIFLLISMCAYTFRDFNLFAVASEPVRQILGYPPPAYLISIALAVYCFSSVTLTLTAMARDARPEQRWNHLGYRCAFFIFYAFSGTIAANFLPVLFCGLSLYILEQCHVWFYNIKVVAQEQDLVEKF